MASKENQEALNTLYESSLNKVSSVEKEKAYQTLQQAIDNEELYKKAFELSTNGKNGNFLKNSLDPNIEHYRDYLLRKAKEELENGKEKI